MSALAATAVRERPIMFSAPMVRALLEGRKTQTRRLVKPQPVDHPAMRPEARDGGRWVFMAHSDRPSYAFATGDVWCPYGAPGDRLWVKETWLSWDHASDGQFLGPPTKMPIEARRREALLYRATNAEPGLYCWRSPLHMTRWASRCTLEVTRVRVERLHAISEEDARAEGVKPSDAAVVFDDKGELRADLSGTHRGAFACLWDSINGKRAPWASNPWLWVVEFRLVQP
jgi:hypothetical protein